MDLLKESIAAEWLGYFAGENVCTVKSMFVISFDTTGATNKRVALIRPDDIIRAQCMFKHTRDGTHDCRKRSKNEEKQKNRKRR